MSSLPKPANSAGLPWTWKEPATSRNSGTPGTSVHLTYPHLATFADGVVQLVWGIPVGGQPSQLHDLTAALPDSEIYARSAIIISAFDGSFWQFFAQDDALIERVRRAFTQVIDATDYRLGE